MVYNEGCDRVFLGKEIWKLGFIINASIMNPPVTANELFIIQKKLQLANQGKVALCCIVGLQCKKLFGVAKLLGVMNPYVG